MFILELLVVSLSFMLEDFELLITQPGKIIWFSSFNCCLEFILAKCYKLD